MLRCDSWGQKEWQEINTDRRGELYQWSWDGWWGSYIRVGVRWEAAEQCQELPPWQLPPSCFCLLTLMLHLPFTPSLRKVGRQLTSADISSLAEGGGDLEDFQKTEDWELGPGTRPGETQLPFQVIILIFELITAQIWDRTQYSSIAWDLPRPCA